jgi:hypothetical protein
LLTGTFGGAAQGELLRDESPVFHAVFLDYLDEPVIFLCGEWSTSYDQPLRDYIQMFINYYSLPL